MKKVIIIGATSAIAKEVAYNFALNNDYILLAGRNEERLNIIKEDISARYNVTPFVKTIDISDFSSHSQFFEEAIEILGGFDTLLIAHGSLTDETITQEVPDLIIKEYYTNVLSVFSIATEATKILRKQKKGTIAVISSVAGDRGRKSNYVYGSTKAAVTNFFEGLRHKLYKDNIDIVIAKPGLVDTPMTANMPKGFLFAKAKTVGKDIYNAIINKKHIVYTPSMWRLIMCIVRNIPDSIFKRMNF